MMTKNYIPILLQFGFVLFLPSILFSQDIEQVVKAKPVAFSGTLGIGMGTYHASGIPPRARDFQYLISGSPTLTLYGVSFPFSVVVSDQQRSFRQPFNQYGVSPQYKWAKGHFGWRNLQFSQFTLGGHVFLGAGVELNPGKLRFGAMYGRFNKAIEDDPVSAPFGQIPTYRRTGYSVKVGYGTPETHVDLNFLKGRDHENSLHSSVTSTIISPAENSVLGLSTRVKILKALYFEGEMAGSVYTRNRMDTARSLIDSMPGALGVLDKWMTINNSSQLLTAGNAALAYRGKMYGVKLEYRRIDPDYQSMGAYYFETDVENYTIAPSLTLHQGKLRLQGSFGLQYDDLHREKAVRSQKTIGSAAVSYQQQLYGIDLRYSNYGISQRNGVLPVIDDYRVARTNHNFNMMGRYTLRADERSNQTLVAVGSVQSLVDLNKITAGHTETNTFTGNVTYQLGYMPYQLNTSVGMTYTKANMSTMEVAFFGPSLSIGKLLYKNKVNINTAWNWQRQQNNGVSAGNVINGNVQTTWRAHQKGMVRAGLVYLNSAANPMFPVAFNEFRTNIGYTYVF